MGIEAYHWEFRTVQLDGLSYNDAALNVSGLTYRFPSGFCFEEFNTVTWSFIERGRIGAEEQ